MLKLKLPFGFKTVCFDNQYVMFTGKIRIKADYYLVNSKLTPNHNTLSIQKTHKGCVIISYVTNDRTIHESNILCINNMLRDIMIDRINIKYQAPVQPCVEHVELIW